MYFQIPTLLCYVMRVAISAPALHADFVDVGHKRALGDEFALLAQASSSHR